MNIPFKTLKLVTIIAESVLESELTSLVSTSGAKGFTISDVRGNGSRGTRVGELPGSNVRIEAIVSADVAERIVTELSIRYFAHYALVCFVTNVDVVRGEKYV